MNDQVLHGLELTC